MSDKKKTPAKPEFIPRCLGPTHDSPVERQDDRPVRRRFRGIGPVRAVFHS